MTGKTSLLWCWFYVLHRLQNTMIAMLDDENVNKVDSTNRCEALSVERSYVFEICFSWCLWDQNSKKNHLIDFYCTLQFDTFCCILFRCSQSTREITNHKWNMFNIILPNTSISMIKNIADIRNFMYDISFAIPEIFCNWKFWIIWNLCKRILIFSRFILRYF